MNARERNEVIMGLSAGKHLVKAFVLQNF